MNIYLLASVLLLTLLPNYAGSEELLKTQKSWNGGDIYYPQGQAEITSIKLRIEKDQTTKFHCHPVPTLGYILKGHLEIESINGKKIEMHEGESLVELMRTVHKGRAIYGPVDIIVFYAGSTTLPNTVYPEDNSGSLHCEL